MARRNNQGRPSPRPQPPPPVPLPVPPSPSSWRDHPLAIATLAVSATLVIGGGLVKDLIIPAYTESLKNQLNEYPAVKKENSDLKKKVSALEEQLRVSRSETATAITANAWVRGDPYPVGLEEVRVGDEISKIDSHFAANSVTKENKKYWSVTTTHPIFHRVTYYFNPAVKPQRVQAVLFHLNTIGKEQYTSDFLLRKLTLALGDPQKDEDNKLFWKVQKAKVEFSQFGAYSID